MENSEYISEFLDVFRVVLVPQRTWPRLLREGPTAPHTSGF